MDEVQTGLGRTGSWWAFERDGVVPDVLTLGKHMGGGVPIGAMITTASVADSAAQMGFVFVHSNSADPVGALAASAVLEIIEDENLLDAAARIGARMRSIFEELASRHEMIGDVRVEKDSPNAIELVRDRETKEPATVAARVAADRCLENGLIVTVRGTRMGQPGNVLRTIPPFTTTDDELDLAATILEEALVTAAAAEERAGWRRRTSSGQSQTGA